MSLFAMRQIALGVLLAGLLSGGFATCGAAAPPVPEGYRMENYRAPVPAALPGATVVTDEEIAWRQDDPEVVFIDAMPTVLGEGALAGRWLPPQPLKHIPGSLWLPNIGYGQLSPVIERYFRTALEQLSPDKKRPLLFYCKADCWMSWNAARRAVEWGYQAVLWYPNGVDGWIQQGKTVEEATPIPLEAVDQLSAPHKAASP